MIIPNFNFDIPIITVTRKIQPMEQIEISWNAEALTFLVGELEKRDLSLLKPLSSATWNRDICFNIGNDGFKDSNESFLLFLWENELPMPAVDKKRLQMMVGSLDELFDGGLRLNWNNTLDMNVYQGFFKNCTTGIMNNSCVATSQASVGSYNQTIWEHKSNVEIINDIFGILKEIQEGSHGEKRFMANHILVPPKNYAVLVKRTYEGKSLLMYIMHSDYGIGKGIDLNIFPCHWCIGAGKGATGRMVVYANNRDTVEFDITVPLARMVTRPSAEKLAYLSTYVGQFSQVKFKRLQSFRYLDGI